MSKIAKMLAHILVYQKKNHYSQGYLCEMCYILLKQKK